MTQYIDYRGQPTRMPTAQLTAQLGYAAPLQDIIVKDDQLRLAYSALRKVPERKETERRVGEAGRQTVRGWTEKRRRSAQRLLCAWRSIAPSFGSPSSAMLADGFVEEIEGQIPVFRQVPYEEAYAGVLQLVRSILTGPNFARVESQQLGDLVESALGLLTSQDRLSLHTYDRVLEMFLERGVVP